MKPLKIEHIPEEDVIFTSVCARFRENSVCLVDQFNVLGRGLVASESHPVSAAIGLDGVAAHFDELGALIGSELVQLWDDLLSDLAKDSGENLVVQRAVRAQSRVRGHNERQHEIGGLSVVGFLFLLSLLHGLILGVFYLGGLAAETPCLDLLGGKLWLGG